MPSKDDLAGEPVPRVVCVREQLDREMVVNTYHQQLDHALLQAGIALVSGHLLILAEKGLAILPALPP